ncbi:MAG: exosome complex protein Rrp42 [Candidatus Aenigmarchaeota archaeon]|nr:exosome complex protein Rrp42 [Candidatus Aenigmarchaeota archaeon]
MNLQEEYMIGLAAKGTRLDKRGLADFRPVTIEKNPISKAEGSARVRMGNTEVIAGVKLDVGTPFPDKPDEGTLIVSAELSPIASPDFELGPPRENAIELSRVVDRGIRESGAIDAKKLCITPKEKVWTVFIDLQILNHDGNLIDACSLASIAALSYAVFPAYDGTRVDWFTKTTEKLPMTATPIAVTVHKIGRQPAYLLVDPTREEEDAATARLTVSTMDDGHVAALQKGEAEPFTLEEVEQAIQWSLAKGKELRALI